MADFDQAIGIILQHEGGFVNDPDDPGGATNYGISLRWVYEELKKTGDHTDLDFDFNHDGVVNADDIKAMTEEEAKNCYRVGFWDPKPFAQINDQTVATKFFDMAVNMGYRQASLIMQRALDGHVVVDGDVGPISIAAINSSVPVKYYIGRVVQEQEKFYRALAAQKPTLAKFLPGWLYRAKWPF